jgi:4-hydroxy-4-methyl-2-oxoglutarate aldolase
MSSTGIGHSELLQLKRWNTPSIYNGWEQVTNHDASKFNFNLEETHDFMPHMGPMVGFAATVVIEPSEKKHLSVENAVADYRRYISQLTVPTIIVVQDLDKPNSVGSTWGEVNANIHKALGCVGTITDGAIRDVDEMCNAGFKAIARRLCVGHAYATPVRWGCEVEVFGTTVKPGQLIHSDKHGFLAIPDEDQQALLEAVQFMDALECDTIIDAARSSSGQSKLDILKKFEQAGKAFSAGASKKFGTKGEW